MLTGTYKIAVDGQVIAYGTSWNGEHHLGYDMKPKAAHVAYGVVRKV